MADPRVEQLREAARRTVRRRAAGLAGARALVARRAAAGRGGRPPDRPARRLRPAPTTRFSPFSTWVTEASEELLGTFAEIDAFELDSSDCLVVIEAPENTRDGSDIPAERLGLRRQAMRPHAEPFFDGTKSWVGCQFATAALAQDAGMGAHRLRGLPLRRGPRRLGRARRADAADRGPLRRRRARCA